MALVSKSDVKDVLKMGLGFAIATAVLTPIVAALWSRFKI